MAERNADRTRSRILDIAGKLFRTQGYAGTSISDIARQLGTSKAALYYHFPSKDDILDAILADSLAAHAGIADLAAEDATAEELLGALIDMVAGAGQVLAMFGTDPSVVAVLAERGRDYKLRDKDDRIIVALAGPQPDAAAMIRVRAAIAVAKDGAREVMASNGGRLSDTDRAELLAAALRAMAPATPPQDRTKERSGAG
ncbi:TetR family transcriptional regulator [Streptomyces pseudoechinosporeus]